MKISELSSSWLSFEKKFGIIGPIETKEHYEKILTITGELMDILAQDEDNPVSSLVEILAERIREYERKTMPWPDTTTPAQVLVFLMDQHGLKQSDLNYIGSQGVVSEILRGHRELNVRQITALSSHLHVSPAAFFPHPNDERFALGA